VLLFCEIKHGISRIVIIHLHDTGANRGSALATVRHPSRRWGAPKSVFWKIPLKFSSQHLKDHICQAIENIPVDMLERVERNFKKRMNQCIVRAAICPMSFLKPLETKIQNVYNTIQKELNQYSKNFFFYWPFKSACFPAAPYTMCFKFDSCDLENYSSYVKDQIRNVLRM